LTDENIGHKLASLLRYHLDDSNGINTDEQGWVAIADIIEHSSDVGLQGCSADDLVRVVEQNSHGTRGKRFELTEGKDRVKATYRHPPKDRRSGFDRDHRGRSDRHRGNSGWHGNGWYDSLGLNYKGNDGWWDNNWKDGWQDGEKGDSSWAQWKAEKPGFSPSPDDAITKDAALESSWREASGKNTQADSDDTPVTDTASSLSPAIAPAAAPCEWEQWFTPDNMEPYFYNTKTEETFFPGDVEDAEEQGWTRYVDTDGERPDKIYWWHEPSSRSFYEEDAIGEAEA
jgi:hypothetical protein